MPSPRIEYAVLPAGEGPGQDRCFTADGLVVVLDGASAYDPSVSPDAGEYVDTLGPELIEQITSSEGIDLRHALAEAIRRTTSKLALVPGNGPSSTVSIVRWGDEAVDVLVLGDSPVVAQFIDGAQEAIVQRPMAHIAPELRQRYRDRLIAGHGYDNEHREILRQLQRCEAPLRNVEGGYWIAEATGGAARFADCRTFRPQDVAWIVAATDGVLPRTTITDHRTWKRIAALKRDALGRWTEELAQWEERIDPDGQIAPRSKRHDDKTLAVLSPR